MANFAFKPPHTKYPRADDDDWYKGKHQEMGKAGIWLIPNSKEPEVGEHYDFHEEGTGDKRRGRVTQYHPEEGITFDTGDKLHKMKSFHQ